MVDLAAVASLAQTVSLCKIIRFSVVSFLNCFNIDLSGGGGGGGFGGASAIGAPISNGSYGHGAVGVTYGASQGSSFWCYLFKNCQFIYKFLHDGIAGPNYR